MSETTEANPKPPPRYSKARKLDVETGMENRDPHNLNPHVAPIQRPKAAVQSELFTSFEEIIGEPDGSHSNECIWKASYKTYQCGKTCCYNCLTFVCAVPLAFCWGCNFACITFMHIWSVTPCFRVFRINCDCAGKFFSTVVHCLLDPCYEALALMFTKIYINIVNTPSAFNERTYQGVNDLVIDRSTMNNNQSQGIRTEMQMQYQRSSEYGEKLYVSPEHDNKLQ